MTQPFVRGEIYFGFKEHFIGLSKYSKKKNHCVLVRAKRGR
jgi:hypothetical protein